MHVCSRNLFACTAVASAVLFAAGCSSGSGGSNVGSSSNQKPIARALVVNSGATNTVRAGAEVFLTGRDSEDPDGPLLDWRWSAPAGIELIERTRTTASFTAPQVDTPTTYSFELTVVDSHNLTDSTQLDVTVVPGSDPDRFLSPKAAQRAPSDSFVLTPALRPGVGAGFADVPFAIRVEAVARYFGRTGDTETFELELEPFAAPIEGVWPAGETVTCAAGQSDTDCMLESYVNSDFRFKIPRLDVAKINQRLLEAGEPNRQLDQHMTMYATIEISAVLDAGPLQDQAVLLVSAGGNVVAESEPSVVGIPAAVTVTTDQLLAAIPGEENVDTADIYYRTVDPYYRRVTLSSWLFNAGFSSEPDGTLLPEAVNGEGEFAHVLYTNNFDLGFGRDMYTRVEPDGDVYAFVVNYPSLEAALKGTDQIVTVAMEFTPPDDPSIHASCLVKGRFVKFFTFAPDELGDSQRINSMNFDGRGERPTPGNCVTCHGGATANLDEIETGAWGQPVYRDCGDTNSTFMPWDLDSFLYSDDDPAITRGARRPDGTPLVDYLDPQRRFSRTAQEEQFRKVNAAALLTYQTYIAEGGDPERVAAAIDLVHGWYDGRPNEPGTTFDGSYLPDGWNVSPEVAAVYHDSYARFCRACHSLRADPTRQFRSYDDFVVDPLTAAPRDLEDVIFRRGIMPLARLTMDRFWVPFDGGSESAAEKLAAVLAADPRVTLDSSARPGKPVFVVTRTPDPAKELDVVRLNASESGFLDAPRWTALGSTENGVCVEPKLIGANTFEVAFRAPLPGRYCIELAGGGDSTVVEFEVVGNQAPQLVAKGVLVVDENAGPTAIDLEYADADDETTDLVYTLVSVVNGTLSLDGTALAANDTFTQQQIDSGLVRYEPVLGVNLAEDVIAPGGFRYTLTDGIAVLGTAAVPLDYTVNVRGVNDGQPTITVSPVTESELVFGGNIVIGSSKLQVADPDSSPTDLTVSVATLGLPAGMITPASRTYQQILNGLGFTYSHNGSFPIDLNDQIQVTVSDGTFTSTPVILNVNARISFSQNIGAVIHNPLDANSCATCHNSTGGGIGAPNFLNAGDTTVSYAAVSSRVTTQETACSAVNSPMSLLLRKPTTLDAHTGGQRPGFDLTLGGNRNNYELFRRWICTFNADNN
jgi:hypothetical protein